jgi:hypothetical protein
MTWRDTNTITNWEFGEIGKLLCDHSPRDLALMIVRLQGQLCAERMLRGADHDVPTSTHRPDTDTAQSNPLPKTL